MPEISEGCVGARKVLQKKHQLRKFTGLLGWPRHYQDCPEQALTYSEVLGGTTHHTT